MHISLTRPVVVSDPGPLAPTLDRMQANGYRISRALAASVLKLAGKSGFLIRAPA